jgi:ribosomal peptide maturation radical SAM protein 1
VRVRPRLVGFTSMFQQHVASLALARLIKRDLPESFIVFGGANCEGVMGAETVRQFPFVDAAVSGEADLVFPELARRVLDGQPVGHLPGVRTREGIEAEFAAGRFSAGPMVRELDALPYPDYGDYFEQFGASRLGPHWQPSIHFETSRGCWWGERMHCTFCGLNGQTMAFRSKSAPRALDELTWLNERHPGCNIDLTDNILDLRYFDEFVPKLAARPLRTELFYEVKANLKKKQLRLLRDAGIRAIQPGIESFSDEVLKLMRKGVSALQNLQLLKWCKELGIDPGWNLLWGFPGEPADEYRRMARLVPLISHLPPPDDYGMIRLDRFSPNFDEAKQRGLDGVAPLPPYRYVYPMADRAVANLAYFFTFRYREPRDVSGYTAPLGRELRAWGKRFAESDLFAVDTGECLLIWDLRPVSHEGVTVLRGIDRILYKACDCASDLGSLGQCLAKSPEGPLGAEAIEQRLAPLVEKGLLVRDGSRYLALAIPLGEYSPAGPARERFYALARRLGKKVPEGWIVSPSMTVDALDRGLRSRRRGRRLSPRPSHRRRLTPSDFSVNERGEVLIRRLSLR